MKIAKLYIFLLMIGMSSCYDDLGNYDYVELNKVSIEGINSNEWYEKLANIDTLFFQPELTFSLSDAEEDLRYEWLLIPINAAYNKDSIPMQEQRSEYVIGREKNLVYPVSKKSGRYISFFNVTNIQTGITYAANFFLKVKTALTDGWMILCEQNGEARLDMISYINETENLVSHDIWRDCDFPLGKPYKLTYDFALSSSNRLVWCEKGTYALDGENLCPSEGSNLALQFAQQPEKVGIACGATPMGTTPYREVLITADGDLYMRNRDDILIGGFFDYRRNREKGGTEYFKLSPWLGFRQRYYSPSTTAILVYDEENRRFLSIENNADYLSQVSFQSLGNVSFSAETGKDLVHMEGNTEGYVFAVLQDPDSKDYYIYGMQLQPDCKIQCSHYVKLNPANTDKIVQFAFHPIYRFLYYATEKGDVYQFNFNTSSSSEKAQKVLSFPGEEIAIMKFNYPVSYVSYEGWEQARWYWLHIASNKSGLPESECGIMRMYDIPDLTSTPQKQLEFSRLGKIVDITYRSKQDEAQKE